MGGGSVKRWFDARAATQASNSRYEVRSKSGGDGSQRRDRGVRERDEQRVVAEAFTISPGAVRRHNENILGKMGAANRTDTVVLAIRAGLVGRPPSPDVGDTEDSTVDRRLAG